MKEHDDKPSVPAPAPVAAPCDTACQVCGEPFADGSTVWCDACHTPHHGACWRYNKGCSTFGCGGKTCLTARPHVPLAADGADPRAPVVLRSWVLWPSATLGMLSVALGTVLSWLDEAKVIRMSLQTRNAIGLLLFVALLGAFLSALLKTHRVFVVHPAKDCIERRLEIVWGLAVLEMEPLRKEDVVEVLLFPDSDAQLALVDGRRVMVASTFTTPPDELKAMAQRAAVALGTTVRVVIGTAPTAEEIRAIGRETQRLRAAEAKALAGAEAPALVEEKKPEA